MDYFSEDQEHQSEPFHLPIHSFCGLPCPKAKHQHRISPTKEQKLHERWRGGQLQHHQEDQQKPVQTGQREEENCCRHHYLDNQKARDQKSVGQTFCFHLRARLQHEGAMLRNPDLLRQAESDGECFR